MGSHHTLDHRELATEALELDPGDWSHGHGVTRLAAEHLQVRAWPDDNPDLAHQLDHRDWIYDHSHPVREAEAERAFDQLNPDFGVPADQHNPYGHQAVRDREAALALGMRGGRPRQPPERSRPGHLAGRPGLPGRRRHPRRPSGVHPNPSRPGADRPRTLNEHTKEHIEHGIGQPHHHRRQPGRGPRAAVANTGIPVTNLRVAVTQRIQQDGEWRDGETSFFKVNVWPGQAEHLADSLSKGDRVMVTGRLRQRSRETPEGEKRSVAEIEADEVGASLKFATAKVERASERATTDRAQGRERQAERGGDFSDAPPF